MLLHIAVGLRIDLLNLRVSPWRGMATAWAGRINRNKLDIGVLADCSSAVRRGHGNEAEMNSRADDGLPLIAAAGLDFEADAARGRYVKVVSGLNRRKYLKELHDQARAGARGIISFGIAGGISPSLKAGDIVVARDVITANRSFKPCEIWSASLLAALPHAHHLPVYGSLEPLLTVSEKHAVWRATGSATVDVESRDAAEVAAYYGLPYAVLRVVLDPAQRAIPLSALVGVDDTGKTDAKAVVKALVWRPQDLHGMVRLAYDARKANLSLIRCRQALGPLLAFGALPDRVGVQGAGYRPAWRYAYASQVRAATVSHLLIHIPRWFTWR